MKDGEPWFVAADVCKVLGIANVTLAVRRLDADEKDLHQLRDTTSALYSIKASAYAPTVNIVNEPQRRLATNGMMSVLPTPSTETGVP